MPLTPTLGAGMPKRSNGRVSGPNPFLEGFVQEDGTVLQDGTLADSWARKRANEKADFEVAVPGEWKEDTIKKGDRVGTAIMRLVGEAAQVESQLRSAADKLGIGVSIDIVKGKRKGMVIVHYEAKARNAYNPKPKPTEAEAEPEVSDAETTTVEA